MRADDGNGLDPREAARLLAQAERGAQRQFNLSPPWITAVTGAVILVAYGFTRLQDMLELTPGNLITHLRKLEDAGYLQSETTGNGRASRTSIALTRHGRAALGAYTDALRDLLGGL